MPPTSSRTRAETVAAAVAAQRDTWLKEYGALDGRLRPHLSIVNALEPLRKGAEPEGPVQKLPEALDDAKLQVLQAELEMRRFLVETPLKHYDESVRLARYADVAGSPPSLRNEQTLRDIEFKRQLSEEFVDLQRASAWAEPLPEFPVRRLRPHR